MFGSLLAALILTAQPMPAEAPVEVEAEMETQVEVQTQAPAPAVEPVVAVEAEAEAAAEPPADIVCRRRLRPSSGIGRRYTVVEDCRPRAEWESRRRRR